MTYTTWSDGDILYAATLNNNFHYGENVTHRGLIEQEWQIQELYCQTGCTYALRDTVIADIFTDSSGYANTVCAGTTSTYDASNDWYTNCITGTDLFSGVNCGTWTELTCTVGTAGGVSANGVCIQSADACSCDSTQYSRCYVVNVSGTDPFYCMNVCLTSSASQCFSGGNSNFATVVTCVNNETMQVCSCRSGICDIPTDNDLLCFEWRYVSDCCYDFYCNGSCKCQVTLTDITLYQFASARGLVSNSVGASNIILGCSEAYSSSVINTVIRTFDSDRCAITIHDDAVTPSGTCIRYDVVSDEGCMLACCIARGETATFTTPCDCFRLVQCQYTSCNAVTSCVGAYGYVTEEVNA